ncbi:GNAT family N-acetyltransferase [Fluoribacter gormanii]|uniref:Acetyltransferase (GNAT) domain-containing protein n=1 Tax=Fluoribacter gormanii TaxID=464 RepID=A0A377GKN4_9GAMM|nr:GNAT family N-acetyltransferase [Fluoribacter gormanii]KTD05355.1 FR47-like protein [Fluoribacter gormanii]MCW8471547.1 GNAT family N-acetyltransferase [Fluoribacter gormanii]SIR62984.1 Acetyltransferase (GNAT) domain-containing protein [Fluoribacter gormanii]STO25341.1 Predicted acetyltransferase [Fluoribacter gormanii]
MIVECKTLAETELGVIYRQLLLNSKLLALIENQTVADPIQIFKASNKQLAVFHPKKNSLFFPAATDPKSALDIFIYLKANYIVKIIECAEELADKIGDYLQKLSENYSSAKMLLMSKGISEDSTSLSSEFEFLKGESLSDFGADVLIAKFSKERLNVILDEEEAKKLILSPSRAFMGLKVSDEVVSIAAWIREIKGYRCLSYVYTDEKYRGQGFSQLLLSKLLNDISGKYKGAFLFVDKSNIPALNLYRKFGFRESGCLAQMKLK